MFSEDSFGGQLLIFHVEILRSFQDFLLSRVVEVTVELCEHHNLRDVWVDV